MNVNDVSTRLERLERENLWMKRAGLAVVGVALAVALIGATTPKEISEFVRARVFQAVDENGNVRAVMGTGGITYFTENCPVFGSSLGCRAHSSMNARGFTSYDENGQERARVADGITYYDEDGQIRVKIDYTGISYRDENEIRSWMAGHGFSHWDDNGKLRITIDASGFVFADENGKPRVLVRKSSMTYRDENNKTRALLGVVETMAKKTGQESRYPAGLALFDEDGKVIWMAPDE